MVTEKLISAFAFNVWIVQTGNKKNTQKGAGSKIAGLWRKESSKKEKSGKQKTGSSKLPVANSSKKSTVKDIEQRQMDGSEKPVNRESSPKPTVNWNTVVLSESVLDGINRSTTFEKLSTTNDHSQVPTYEHETDDYGSDLQSKIMSSHRPATEFEVGVEYSLDDAWSANVEKSIEAMSRSIEEAKSKKDSFYTEDLDISKMNLDESPAKRLSKSGSMSEIELEFGSRINSGTWKKKKSQNDFSVLPNADETCRTLPLVKRAESLNLSAMNRCQSSEYSINSSIYGWKQLDSDLDGDDIWVKRDTKCGMNTTKSKKKGFHGSSGFLPFKNAVKSIFGSKKGDKDKQSKSFSVSDKDAKKFDELKKMSESMNVSQRKRKMLNQLRLN